MRHDVLTERASSALPTRCTGITGTPQHPIEESSGHGQRAEHLLADTGRGAVEHPWEELGGSLHALLPPHRVPESVPALRAQIFLDEREGILLLVLHVS